MRMKEFTCKQTMKLALLIICRCPQIALSDGHTYIMVGQHQLHIPADENTYCARYCLALKMRFLNIYNQDH